MRRFGKPHDCAPDDAHVALRSRVRNFDFFLGIHLTHLQASMVRGQLHSCEDGGCVVGNALLAIA
jgi:hypothetical protein